MASRTEGAERFVRQALHGSRFGDVRWVAATGSTNDDLAAAAASGGDEQVLIADLQTAGRGRRDRRWDAPAGSSILMSLLLRRRADHGFWTVGAVALGASDAIRAELDVPCHLKWPNDLLVAERKVAGVLAQAADGAVIVGIGVNVDWAPEPEMSRGDADRGPEPAPRLRATALSRHVEGRVVDRPALVVAMLDAVAARLDQPLAEMRPAWRDRCATLGTTVRVDVGGSALEGRAVAVDEDGGLIVETSAGREAVHVGDVVHLRSISP